MKTRKILTIIGIIMILSLVFAACKPAATEAPPAEEPAEEEPVVEEPSEAEEPVEEEPAEEEPVEEEPPAPSVVVVSMTAQPDSWLSDFSVTATAGYAQAVVYNSLVKTNRAGELVGDLAESWELSDDLLTWTFHLREDALWHDGTPFTAMDVKYTYEIGADPDYAGGFSDMSLALVGGAEKQAGEAEEISGIVILDDHTITLTTVEPNALFLNTIALKPIIPYHILKDVPIAELSESEQAQMPIGTGPYMVTDIKPDETITFTAFADYFGGAPLIDTYIWRILPELSVMVTELLAGNVDFDTFTPPEEFDSLAADPELQSLRVPGVAMTLGEMNQLAEIPFFVDKRTRQALAYAVDKEAMNLALNNGMGTVITTPVHPSLAEFNPNIEAYPYDPEKAMTLLDEVGWKDEDGDGIREAHGIEGIEDGTPFSFVLGAINIRRYVPQALIAQDYFKAVGIDVQVEEVEFNIFWSEYEVYGSPDWYIAGTGWFNLSFPPQTELQWNYTDWATGGWFNPEVAEMIAEAPTIFDPEERQQHYWKIQEMIVEDCSVLYWTREDNLFTYRNGLVIPEDIKSLPHMFSSVPEWYWE